MSVLRETYTEAELDSVRLDLNAYLLSCSTLDQLHGKIFTALKEKRASEEVCNVNHGNHIGS